MNIFFGILSHDLKYKLTVPKFQNYSEPQNIYKLFTIKTNNNKWIVEKTNCIDDKYFYYVNSNSLSQNSFFFLAKDKEIEKINENNYTKILNLNSFTNTIPSFRANMRIYNKFGGFSSYQSEYPYGMTVKNGSIMSPLSSLSNKQADYNKVFVTNIFHQPVIDKFKIYFINISLKKILYKKEIYTNSVNEIEIHNEFINPDVFLFTDRYLGVPVFVSCKDNHLSCEHTHPPHEYIISKDKYLRISELKKEMNEIIS